MKIGNVLINTDYYDSSLHYSDGDVEEEILKIVKTSADYSYALEKTDNWAILYHLHKDRENILSWYPFTGTEDALEIGAGCGALTGLLAQKCKSVMCNDISLRRSEINAYKNARFENIEIRVGNFTDVKFDKQFDIITLIGVLEYAACYVEEDNPAVTMLKMVSSMLKPGGKVLLAIENKFGLKYWAGCREDHTGKFFEGLMGYPDTKGIRTYSKRELQNIFMD
ncbi:MAG: class I SAM-dependent methyltransferase, partial [Christensenella sp.]|uniref:class I SAM-dependent methyltransferase n=1 Tax=Christensenella sp. TaxID=1935934 RepID=UPI002B1EA58A